MARTKPSRWARFVSVTKNRKPIPYITEGASLVTKHGRALDLGCGAGVDARYLAESGMKVTAIDNDRAAIRSTRTLCAGLSVKTKQMDLKDVHLGTENVDLVVAWNSLPFLKRRIVKQILTAVEVALIPGGIFVFSLLGPEDAWAKRPTEMSFFSQSELRNILKHSRFIEVKESWREGPDAAGHRKFWHRVQGIAQKAKALERGK
jgi:cyclopropane fatty-acyl-phospholipid synthase-like methyltransferase